VQAAAEDRAEIEVGDQQVLVKSGRASDAPAARVEDDAAAVEDQFSPARRRD
jgi:hypothetical protein